MKVPAEFEALGSAFYAGSYVDGMSVAEWISARVSILDAREKKVSESFLDELLAGEPNADRLQEAWRSSDSDYCFDSAGIGVFLTMLREALSK